MTYLRQILPFFFLPIGITLILLVAGLLSRRRALLWSGLGVLWLSSTPLVGTLLMRMAEGWAERRPAAPAPTADAIVVLSVGRMLAPGRAGISEWRDPDRFFGGIELFRAGKAPLLIFTGGWLSWRREGGLEGDTLTSYARSFGVPTEAMATTGFVTNTAEEAQAVARLLRERRPAAAVEATPRVLLVTSAFHMARARVLFERAGLTVLPFPVDFQASAGGIGVMSFVPSADALGQTEKAWRELYGRLFYSVVR